MPFDKNGKWLTAEERKAQKLARRLENRTINAIEQDKIRHMRTTPEGKKERQKALLERLLSDDNMNTVMNKVLEIVQNDDHPAQGAMLKECMNRMIPVSMFEDKANRGHSQINISITGIEPEIKGEIIEGDQNG